MTKAEILNAVAKRVFDEGARDYSPVKLAPIYRQALDTLSQRLAANSIDEVTSTHYGRAQRDATIISLPFHGIPVRAPRELQIASLQGTYTLRSKLPEVVEDGVQIAFEQPISAPSDLLYIAREKRMPAINGEWKARLSEDKLSALLVDVSGTVQADDIAANAGNAYTRNGPWLPVTLNQSGARGLSARFEQDRFQFNRPLTMDVLFALKTRGFSPESFMDDASICPVANAETFLINQTLRLALGDRMGGEAAAGYTADAEGAWTLLLANLISRKQASTPPPVYPIPGHRRQSWWN